MPRDDPVHRDKSRLLLLEFLKVQLDNDNARAVPGNEGSTTPGSEAGWARASQLGGKSHSWHSSRLRKLVADGLVDRRVRAHSEESAQRRHIFYYRITQRGLDVLGNLPMFEFLDEIISNGYDARQAGMPRQPLPGLPIVSKNEFYGLLRIRYRAFELALERTVMPPKELRKELSALVALCAVAVRDLNL